MEYFSLIFFAFVFVNSLLLDTCAPWVCRHAKMWKKKNNQRQQWINRHFIATVAQFMGREKKSHHPHSHIHEHSHFGKHSFLFGFFHFTSTHSMLHACKLIYYIKKRSQIIRFDDDPQTKYVLSTHTRGTSHYLQRSFVRALVHLIHVFVWNAYTSVG